MIKQVVSRKSIYLFSLGSYNKAGYTPENMVWPTGPKLCTYIVKIYSPVWQSQSLMVLSAEPVSTLLVSPAYG